MTGKWWSQQELDFLQEYYTTKSPKWIAKQISRTINSIHVKASRLGLVSWVAWTQKEKDYLRQSYYKVPIVEMAKVLGKKKGTISAMACAMGLSHHKNTIPPNHNYFNDFKARQSWVLGFWAADGCISIRENRAPSIFFSQKERDILEKICAEFEWQGKISLLKGTRGHCYNAGFTSQPIYDFMHSFFNCSLERKSNTLKWPSKLPVEYSRDFCRGLVDGDGCIRIRYDNVPMFSFASGSLSIATGFVQQIFSDIGIQLKVHKRKSGVYISECGGTKAVCIAHYLYHNSELHLDRKYQIYLKMLGWLKGRRRQKLSPKAESLFSNILQGSTNV